MTKVDQKKILVFGGTKHMINVVETVKWLGMSPIVIDNVIGSPAKRYADKSYNTSTSNIKGLTKIVQEEEVNGVFIDFENIYTWDAIALCKKLGLPFLALEGQFGHNSTKEKIMEICRHFDILVVEEKLAGDYNEKPVAFWEFSVSVKPINIYDRKEKSFC